NQGMILGQSAFVNRVEPNIGFSSFVKGIHPLKDENIVKPTLFLSDSLLKKYRLIETKLFDKLSYNKVSEKRIIEWIYLAFDNSQILDEDERVAMEIVKKEDSSIL